MLTVTRSEANGGQITYESFENLFEDYELGALHPGDLKMNGIADVMVSLLENLSSAFKSDKDATQAAKCLKAQTRKK